MNSTLQTINELTGLKRSLFMENIFRSEQHQQTFLGFLASLDADEQTRFWDTLPAHSLNIWKKRVHETSPLDVNKQQQAEQTLTELLQNVEQQTNQIEKNTEEAQTKIADFRQILKANFLQLESVASDQMRQIPIPPIQKQLNNTYPIVELPQPDAKVVINNDLFACIGQRQSRRKFSDQPLSLAELSYLLWATQGVRQVIAGGKVAFRTVPSGGARHPFETYLAVQHVENLDDGIYLYRPLEHQLLLLESPENLSQKLTEAALGQTFVGQSAVTFMWSILPYRCEWRYTLEAKKIVLQDSGHLCQNLYLAAESIACGTCAIGAYHQDLFDQLLHLDGQDEFVVYVAPVGKLTEKE